MPKVSFLFKYNEPAPLEISWSEKQVHLKENFQIRYQGRLLGEFPTQSELEKGQKFELQDGSTLEIKLIADRFNILHNGKHLPEIPDVKKNQLAIFAFSLLILFIGGYATPNTSQSEASHSIYFNVSLCLSILGIIIGLTLKRFEFLGYTWFYFLSSVTLLAYFLVALQVGESIRPMNIFALLLWLFGFAHAIYKFYRRNKD